MFAYLSVDAGAHFNSVGASKSPHAPSGNPNGSTLVAAAPATAVAACDLPGSLLTRPSTLGRH